MSDLRNSQLAGTQTSVVHMGEAVATSIDPDIFPSLSELAQRFAKLRPKARSEANLGGELYRICPDIFAQIYHPIATKFLFTCIPPVQWAGGVLFELLKPGGSPTTPKGYRDITVTDADSKPTLSHLRAKAAPHLFKASPPGQFWGGAAIVVPLRLHTS